MSNHSSAGHLKPQQSLRHRLELDRVQEACQHQLLRFLLLLGVRRQRHETPQRREVLAEVEVAAEVADQLVEEVLLRGLQRLDQRKPAAYRLASC